MQADSRARRRCRGRGWDTAGSIHGYPSPARQITRTALPYAAREAVRLDQFDLGSHEKLLAQGVGETLLQNEELAGGAVDYPGVTSTFTVMRSL